GCAGGIHLADELGNRHVDSVPVEADATVREPKHRLVRRECPPTGVLVVRGPGMRNDVVRAVRNRPRPEWVVWRTELDEIDLFDVCVGVAPLPADERNTVNGLEI